MSVDPIDTVLVAGATGDTGQELLRVLAPLDVEVRALTRSSEARSRLRADGADDVVVDDLLAPTALDEAVADVDTVLSAVGSGPTDLLGGGPLVDGAGTRALLEAAVDAGVSAFVMESALGVGSGPASPLASLFDVAIGPIQRAKADAEEAIEAADIRHTILRPGVLVGGSRTHGVTVAEPGAKLWGLTTRADVAYLMVAALATEAAADAAFEVVTYPRFRHRALDIDWELP